jgi:hypothetical protein
LARPLAIDAWESATACVGLLQVPLRLRVRLDGLREPPEPDLRGGEGDPQRGDDPRQGAEDTDRGGDRGHERPGAGGGLPEEGDERLNQGEDPEVQAGPQQLREALEPGLVDLHWDVDGRDGLRFGPQLPDDSQQASREGFLVELDRHLDRVGVGGGLRLLLRLHDLPDDPIDRGLQLQLETLGGGLRLRFELGPQLVGVQDGLHVGGDPGGRLLDGGDEAVPQPVRVDDGLDPRLEPLSGRPDGLLQVLLQPFPVGEDDIDLRVDPVGDRLDFPFQPLLERGEVGLDGDLELACDDPVSHRRSPRGPGRRRRSSCRPGRGSRACRGPRPRRCRRLGRRVGGRGLVVGPGDREGFLAAAVGRQQGHLLGQHREQFFGWPPRDAALGVEGGVAGEPVKQVPQSPDADEPGALSGSPPDASGVELVEAGEVCFGVAPLLSEEVSDAKASPRDTPYRRRRPCTIRT